MARKGNEDILTQESGIEGVSSRRPDDADLKDRLLPPVSIIDGYWTSAVSGQVTALILCRKSQTGRSKLVLGKK